MNLRDVCFVTSFVSIKTTNINTSSCPEFSLERGLRQGDPLSPLLLILVMEGLHLSLEKDLLTKPIKGVSVGRSCINLSHFFFADDVIILSEWNVQDLHNIMSTLNSFYQEYEPCVELERLDRKVHKKLSKWKASLLSIGDRFTLIKSVLGSLGIYYFSLFKAPETVINTLEKYNARFFWGGASEKRNMAWVRWDQALASHEKGGLNIGSLKAFNLALLQKWRWRFSTNPNLLWVNLIKVIHGFEAGFDGKGYATSGIWSTIVDLTNYLHSRNFLPKDVLKCHPGNGNKIRFWKDHWIGDEPLSIKYNRLYHLDVNENCLLDERYSEGAWNWNWLKPIISCRIHTMFQTLQVDLAHVICSSSQDVWKWNIVPVVPSLSSWTSWIEATPGPINKKRKLLVIIVCMFWTIWKFPNDVTFNS
nr:RNA-directed DNA polymerase, eukaryota, reverse transcriptase zinc-binding domain protein [Tanacetum cinerariifolium]